MFRRGGFISGKLQKVTVRSERMERLRFTLSFQILDFLSL
jgi:hypothetical protein